MLSQNTTVSPDAAQACEHNGTAPHVLTVPPPLPNPWLAPWAVLKPLLVLFGATRVCVLGNGLALFAGFGGHSDAEAGLADPFTLTMVDEAAPEAADLPFIKLVSEKPLQFLERETTFDLYVVAGVCDRVQVEKRLFDVLSHRRTARPVWVVSWSQIGPPEVGPVQHAVDQPPKQPPKPGKPSKSGKPGRMTTNLGPAPVQSWDFVRLPLNAGWLWRSANLDRPQADGLSAVLLALRLVETSVEQAVEKGHGLAQAVAKHEAAVQQVSKLQQQLAAVQSVQELVRAEIEQAHKERQAALARCQAVEKSGLGRAVRATQALAGGLVSFLKSETPTERTADGLVIGNEPDEDEDADDSEGWFRRIQRRGKKKWPW